MSWDLVFDVSYILYCLLQLMLLLFNKLGATLYCRVGGDCRVGWRRSCPFRRWLGAWSLDGLSYGWFFRAAFLPSYFCVITFASIYYLLPIIIATWWWDFLSTCIWAIYIRLNSLGDFWKGVLCIIDYGGELFCTGL